MRKHEREARKWVIRELGMSEHSSYLDVALAAMQNSHRLIGVNVQWDSPQGYEPAAVLTALRLKTDKRFS